MDRRKWFALSGAAVTVFAGAAGYFGLQALEHRTVWRLVGAPNYGEAPTAEPPHPEVDHAFRMTVGPPSAELDIWVLEPDSPPTGTVFVLHGVYDKKRTMVGFAKMLRTSVGLRAVLVDLRGHGHSTGDFLSFGQVDSRDLVQLMDRLEDEGRLVAPVSIYGPSYGAAVALQTAERDPRISNVVAVATFASFERILLPYIDHFHPQLAWLLPDSWSYRVLEAADQLASIELKELDNVRAIQNTEAHVLVMHGEDDRIISLDQAEALYDACGPERCRLVVFPGANHAESMSGDTLNRETVAWMKRGVQRADLD
ncbi:MAG: alpha/beta fold hydrolase [Myxococcota bacterium]